MNITNKDLVNEFLEFWVAHRLVKRRTYLLYKEWISNFADWYEHQAGKINMLEATDEDIVQYQVYLRDNYRNAVIISFMFAVKMFFNKWACHETIQKRVKPITFPPSEESPSKSPGYTPTCQEIFKMRREYWCDYGILNAVFFECLISSGMRRSELMQVRACDLNWNVKLIDNELKRLSPYISCSVELNSNTGMELKTKKPRITFFSKIAGKLLRKYMEMRKIPVDSNLPLFPVQKDRFIKRFNEAGEKCALDRRHEIMPKKRLGGIGFTDVVADDLDAPDEYKEAIRKAQRAEASLDAQVHIPIPVGGSVFRGRRIDKHKKRKFSPHSCRHFFGLLMYYRNYYGNRQDCIGVRDLLGHADVTQTETYLAYANHVSSDHEWKRIMVGNGNEYIKFEYGPGTIGGKW